MKEKYEKLKKQIIILSIMPVVSVLLILLLFVFAQSSDSAILGFVLLVLLASCVASIILLPMKLWGFLSLKKYSGRFDELLSGIDLTAEPELKENGIYCGDNALYTTKENLLIPYDDFSWSYYLITRLYIFIKIKRAVICFKNGKAVKIKCSEEEYMYIMNKYIIPHVPDILIGYNAENIKEYRRRYKEWKKSRK